MPLKYSPSLSISFTPSLHISLICRRESQAPLQTTAIICSFWGQVPEVLHSVRTCNVESISAAIRLHPLQGTSPVGRPCSALSLSILGDVHISASACFPPRRPSTYSLARSSDIPDVSPTLEQRRRLPPPFPSPSVHIVPLTSPPLPPGGPCKLLIQQLPAIKICNDIFKGKEACVVFNSYLMAVRLNSPLS